MTGPKKTRRGILKGISAALAGALPITKASAAALTPSASEGPFYPTPAMRYADNDNDLVKIIGVVREAGGEVITLKGRVVDESGAGQAGLRVEIWQCDVNGKYLHSGDTQAVAADAAFQGFGHDITRADGAYIFRTIKPVRYPGRTPHIHVKVFDGTQNVLTTQFYIKNEATNPGDFLFREMTAPEQQAVLMEFRNGENGVETVIDITV